MDTFNFDWMLGRRATVSFLEPDSWFIALGESLGIRIECPWRLLQHGVIAVSSDDHRQQFGLPAPVDAAERASFMLADAAVLRVEFREGTADLLIHFENDNRLEVIPFSSGYESWEICAPGGKNVIALGGGKVSVP